MRKLVIYAEIIWYKILHLLNVKMSTKEIPKGMYCYTMLTKPGSMENGKWGYKTKPCK